MACRTRLASLWVVLPHEVEQVLWGLPIIAPSTVRLVSCPSRVLVSCGSSVVEHTLGKGEVESSILSRSTRKIKQIQQIVKSKINLCSRSNWAGQHLGSTKTDFSFAVEITGAPSSLDVVQQITGLSQKPSHSPALSDRVLGPCAVSKAPIRVARGATASLSTTVHPTARLAAHRWRAAWAPRPCPRAALPAAAQRRGLEVCPLHGLDARFHVSPLPRAVHWRQWRH